MAIVQDITRRKQAEEQGYYHTTLLHHLADAVIATDLAFRIHGWNPAATRLYGWQAEEVLGQPAGEVIPTEYVTGSREQFREHLMATGQWSGEVRQTRKDGSTVPVLAAVSLVKNDAGTPVGVVTVTHDISERKALEAAWQHRAFHDPLTGLPNRAFLLACLEQALARAERHQTAVALLFVDLDDFKAINDQCGHLVGDQVLVAVAERLRAGVRQAETVARFGGDEFVVLLEDLVSRAEAERVVERMRGQFRAAVLIEGQVVPVMASIGLAYTAAGQTHPADLLRAADAAMYRAKTRG